LIRLNCIILINFPAQKNRSIFELKKFNPSQFMSIFELKKENPLQFLNFKRLPIYLCMIWHGISFVILKPLKLGLIWGSSFSHEVTQFNSNNKDSEVSLYLNQNEVSLYLTCISLKKMSQIHNGFWIICFKIIKTCLSLLLTATNGELLISECLNRKKPDHQYGILSTVKM
jgi:hypothetical protein